MKRLEVSTRKTFIRFLVSYVIILFIPIIIGAIAYNIAFHTVEDAVIQSNTMLLGQSMRVLDRRLAEMDSLVEQLLWTPEVKSFSYITKPFEGSQVCRIIDTKKAIYSYSISNNFIEGYYLLFKNSNMVLTPNIIYTIPSFYKNYLTYENIDYKKWYNMILGKYCYKEYLPSMSVNLNGKKYSMITYVQSLGYGTYYNGAVMVLINSNEIEKLFSDIDISDGGCIYIADQNDHIIVQIGSNEASLITLKGLDKVAGVKKQSINGKNMLITYVTSKYNGWKYVTVQPIHIVMERLLYVKKVTAYIVLMSLILGIIAAYFWAYKNNMPIKLIVKMIKDKFSIENHESSNAYELIQSTITDLISMFVVK